MESVSGVDGNKAIPLFLNEWFANPKAELKKLEEMELRTEGKKTLSNGLKVHYPTTSSLLQPHWITSSL
jgi:hypothetical protein